MKYILHVAEKPDAAKKVAAILSNNKCVRKQGASKFNPVWEFDFNFEGAMAKFMFTSVAGHIYESDFDDAHRNWSMCDPVVLFDIATPIVRKVRADLADCEKNLRIEANRAQKLVLWLDCDREGENIAFEVIDICKAANHRLAIENNTILRARFSEFTQR